MLLFINLINIEENVKTFYLLIMQQAKNNFTKIDKSSNDLSIFLSAKGLSQEAETWQTYVVY